MQNDTGEKEPGFFQTRTGHVFLVFMASAAILLVVEHRSHITGNWLLVGLLALCIGVHFFMHSAHSGHDHDNRE